MRRLLIILTLTLGAPTLHARLGENGAELQKRFGAPVRQLKQPGQDLVQNQYFDRDLMVYVTLFKNRSVVEHYLRLKTVPIGSEQPVVIALPMELAKAILQANAAGSQWQQAGETVSDLRLTRSDQRALAVVMKKDGVPVEVRVCDIDFVEHLVPPAAAAGNSKVQNTKAR